MINVTPKATHTLEYDHLLKSPVKLTAEIHLVKAAANPKEMDEWQVKLTTEYPGEMILKYSTGTGHRKRHKQRMSVLDWENSRPVPPQINDILHCIGMDYQMARDLPRDEVAAMDAYTAEFGPSDNPSDTLKTIRALNKAADDLQKLLRGTGIDVDHFADWANNLDS